MFAAECLICPLTRKPTESIIREPYLLSVNFHLVRNECVCVCVWLSVRVLFGALRTVINWETAWTVLLLLLLFLIGLRYDIVRFRVESSGRAVVFARENYLRNVLYYLHTRTTAPNELLVPQKGSSDGRTVKAKVQTCTDKNRYEQSVFTKSRVHKRATHVVGRHVEGRERNKSKKQLMKKTKSVHLNVLRRVKSTEIY